MTGPETPAAAARMVGALRESLRGEAIDRLHPAYDAARQVWNGLIDRYPAVIARCAGTSWTGRRNCSVW